MLAAVLLTAAGVLQPVGLTFPLETHEPIGAAKAQESALGEEVKQLIAQLAKPAERKGAVDELSALHLELRLSMSSKSDEERGDRDLVALRVALVLASLDLPRPGAPESSEYFWEFVEEGVQAVWAENRDSGARWLAYDTATQLMESGLSLEADEIALWALDSHAGDDPYAFGLHRLRFARAVQSGELERALELGDAIQELAARLGNPNYEVLASEAKARVALGLGLFDVADTELRRGELVARNSGGGELASFLLLQRLDWALLMEAFEFVEERVETLRASENWGGVPPNHQVLLELQLGIALSEMEREDPGRPRLAAVQLRKFLSEVPDSATQCRVRLHLADLALRANDLEDARSELKHARELGASDGGGSGAAFLENQALLAAYETRADLQEGPPSERHVQAMDRATDLLKREWGTVQTRPRGGIGFLYSPDRREVLSVALQVDLRLSPGQEGWRNALSRLLEVLSVALQVDLRLTPGQQSRRTALSGLLEVQTLDSLTQEFLEQASDTSISLEAVQKELLRPGGGCLVYLPSKNVSHLFLFDSERVDYVQLESWDVLQDASSRLADLLGRLPATGEPTTQDLLSRLDKANANLRRLLLPAQAEAILKRWQGVSVVGFPLIDSLPFDCLKLSDGTMLGERIAVDTLPSLSSALLLRRRAKPLNRGSSRVALVATLLPGDGQDLPESLVTRELSPSELKPLTAPFAGAGSSESVVLELFNKEATPKAVKELLAAPEGIDIAHFLCHGHYARNQVRPAALVLHDGLVLADDVERDYRLDGLVILSVCDAAVGPARFGDDALAHLGGAFLRTGARCVMLSKGPIPYRGTVELMGYVHTRLAAGDSPAEALRSARVALRANAEDGEAGALGSYRMSRIQALGLGQWPLFDGE